MMFEQPIKHISALRVTYFIYVLWRIIEFYGAYWHFIAIRQGIGVRHDPR